MAKSKFRQLASAAEDLVSRTKESYQTRDSTGKYENCLSSDVPLPEWKCKEGDHILDIVPWIAGPNHPTVDEGKGTYLLDLWVHQKIGVNENEYVCPSRNYGKPCPICEDIAAIKKTKGYDEDYVKSVEPKRRVVYAIIVYDSPQEEQQSPYVWEASHFLTEKNISAIARNKRTGGFISFANPDTGKTIEFTREGSGIGTKYSGYMLTERDYVIPDEILDAVPSLDDYIDILEYEELSNIYYGGAAPEEEGGECEYQEDATGGYQAGDDQQDGQGYYDDGDGAQYDDPNGDGYAEGGEYDTGEDPGAEDSGEDYQGEDPGTDDDSAPPDEVAQEAEQQEEKPQRTTQTAGRGGGRLASRGAAKAPAKKAPPRQGRAPLRTAGNARIGRRQPAGENEAPAGRTVKKAPPKRAPLRGKPAAKQSPARGAGKPAPRTGTRLNRRPVKEGE